MYRIFFLACTKLASDHSGHLYTSLCYPTAKVSCVYEIYVHRLVIEGVITIVYAIIVRTYTAFRAQHRTKLVMSKKIARAIIKISTNTSYFSMINQLENFEILQFLFAGSNDHSSKSLGRQCNPHLHFNSRLVWTFEFNIFLVVVFNFLAKVRSSVK